MFIILCCHFQMPHRYIFFLVEQFAWSKDTFPDLVFRVLQFQRLLFCPIKRFRRLVFRNWHSGFYCSWFGAPAFRALLFRVPPFLVWWHAPKYWVLNSLAVGFWTTWATNSLIPPFKPKKIFFTSNNMIFNLITHTHFFALFNLKKHLKIGLQENNQHIFLWNLKIWIKKKIFKNLKILKIGMPKKMTPKSQAKIKPQFPQYSILTIF